MVQPRGAKDHRELAADENRSRLPSTTIKYVCSLFSCQGSTSLIPLPALPCLMSHPCRSVTAPQGPNSGCLLSECLVANAGHVSITERAWGGAIRPRADPYINRLQKKRPFLRSRRPYAATPRSSDLL